jgi:hypothetical protein
MSDTHTSMSACIIANNVVLVLEKTGKTIPCSHRHGTNMYNVYQKFNPNVLNYDDKSWGDCSNWQSERMRAVGYLLEDPSLASAAIIQ